jgi:hypothetical protein
VVPEVNDTSEHKHQSASKRTRSVDLLHDGGRGGVNAEGVPQQQQPAKKEKHEHCLPPD